MQLLLGPVISSSPLMENENNQFYFFDLEKIYVNGPKLRDSTSPRLVNGARVWEKKQSWRENEVI